MYEMLTGRGPFEATDGAGGQFRGQTENEIALAYSGMRRQDLAARYCPGSVEM